MGYEVKKVIEFGRENTKPVGLLKGAILLKDGTEQVLQLKLRNNGKDILNRVTVKITCIGKDGQAIGEQNYTYEKIFITSGTEFGTDVAIPLKYENVESVVVETEIDLERIKVSSKNISKKEWTPTWFPKIYNVLVIPFSIFFLIYHTIVLINWKFLINEKISLSPWIIGGGYGTSVQLFFAVLSTTAIYLYPMTQLLLNKNQANYRKLLISNLAQILMVLILMTAGLFDVLGLSEEYYLCFAGCLILVLIHTAIIENNRNKIFLLLIGLTVLLITFKYYEGGSHGYGKGWIIGYNGPRYEPSSIFIFCEYLKLCINAIGTFVIIKKKFKLR